MTAVVFGLPLGCFLSKWQDFAIPQLWYFHPNFDTNYFKQVSQLVGNLITEWFCQERRWKYAMRALYDYSMTTNLPKLNPQRSDP